MPPSVGFIAAVRGGTSRTPHTNRDAGRPHPARLSSGHEEEKDIQYVLAQLRVLMIALSSSSGQCRTCPNN
jgi:hypothetical protein